MIRTCDHPLLDLVIAGRVLEACSGFRDAGASAALWETVAPDLLGQPIADIAEYASAQRAAGGADADAWGGVASALARSSRTTSSPIGGTARGLHEVVEVIGDVTAVVATARAVAAPIAALVRRALDRRRQRAQSGDVQIEVDLPPAASPVGCRDDRRSGGSAVGDAAPITGPAVRDILRLVRRRLPAISSVPAGVWRGRVSPHRLGTRP